MAPLTEHENRQLRLIEEQLRAEDPKFAKAMRSKRMGSILRRPITHNSRFILVTFMFGLAVITTGMAMQNFVLGSLGFVIVYVSFIRICYNLISAQATRASAPATHHKTKSAFMANLEYQWDERKKNDH